ncbi:XrtA system polysaccharide deacetylase [Glaciecola sp. 1036]|uniref:XrtA system polysaccharide deacetylase n=1 Tax=Alteromonadaceae TaxID=72275 RepID=UPI003D010F6E
MSDINQNKNAIHAMTVDVEDYFHVSAFESVISPADWDSLALRVELNTNRLIDLFNKHDVKATFFTLGWVAKRCPELIKRIVAEGHELSSHGFNHRRNTAMQEKEVIQDITESKDLLEQISGEKVIGYRAPSFSINDSNQYIYSLLVDLGFEYSSSTYPIQHDLYGVPDWPRFAHKREEGIIEIPIPTILAGGENKGIGGGGFFRLFPYWLSKKRIEAYLKETDQPYNFYFHPWEIDAKQPRISNAPFKSKLRHYINLASMEKKLEKLMLDYRFSSMKNVYSNLL